MICKKCNQEMPEIGDFCPFCGEPKKIEEVLETETVELAEEIRDELTEEAEAVEAAEDTAEETAEEAEEAPAKKKIKPLHLVVAIVAGLALVVSLVLFVLQGTGVNLDPKGDLFSKDIYAVEADVLEKSADKVVATMGNKKLTVAELQLYYTNCVYSFYANNFYYMSMIGLDMEKPLSEQPYYADPTMTWEQYFLDGALKSWQSYTLVELLAESEGFTVKPEVQVQIDGMPDQLSAIATNNGFASVDEYLYEQMAPGVTLDTYLRFNTVYYYCNEYLNSAYETAEYTQEDLDAYYADNEGVFLSSGIVPDIGLQSDVRHILIQPENGTADESGKTVYSDEDWAAALEKAEAVLAEWKAGEATEESFAALVPTYSMDGGSVSTGGLYTGINIDSSYVPEFLNWAVDSSRNSGDVEIVKTEYGYHIMYFVEGEDYFHYVVAEQYVASMIQEKLEQAKEEYPAKINYKKIMLAQASFS